MRKTVLLFTALLIMTACGKKVTPAELDKINGYWEIEKVVMPDGTEKDYSVNPTVDFFEVKNNQGTRKKVMPQYDGTYIVNGNSEAVKLDADKEGDVTMHYTTDYAKWDEALISINDENLVVKNQHGITYYYKRPKPFTLKDGKEK